MDDEAGPGRPVTIGVLTYRRPHLLPGTLKALVGHLDAERPHDTASRILVVDNDPAGSAEEAVRSAGSRVRYVHEPQPGIAAARQRALVETPTSHFLAFIDDDEVPSPQWLAHLLATWVSAERPAAVAGRVIPRYEVEPPEWIAAGGFFVRRSLPTGTTVEAAGAGNLMLDLAQVSALGLSFDASLGTRGGEDTLFTSELTRRGGRIVWCEEAAATDLVPADRLTRRWILRRAYSHGTVTSMVRLRSCPAGPTKRVRARLVLGGAGRMIGGVLRGGAGVVSGSPFLRARGPWLVCRGAGVVAGALGSTYDEYGRGR